MQILIKIALAVLIGIGIVYLFGLAVIVAAVIERLRGE